MSIKNFYYEHKRHFSLHQISKSSVVVLLFLLFCFGGQTLLQIWSKASSDVSGQLQTGLTIFDEQETSVTESEEQSTADTTQKVNINTASKTELMTLPNIGEKKAEDIIAKREQSEFETIEDIKEVKGIGEKTFEKLSEAITV